MSKSPEKPAANGDIPTPVAKSKKKLIILIAAVLLLTVMVGGGAALFLSKKKGTTKESHTEDSAKAHVFLSLEQFVVNLQSDTGDKYLQVQITLEANDETESTLIKANTPQIRSRLLMLLSSKNADEILSPSGKDKLIKEIKTQINLPFTPKGEPQKVNDVFFTSFIVQ